MNEIKLFDSELKLMELIWEKEPIAAKDLHVLATERIGWNKNTTYTVLKKLVEKQAVQREEPGFICTALIGREEVGRTETKSLIDRLFKGSKKAFFAAFLEEQELSREELMELRSMIDKR